MKFFKGDSENALDFVNPRYFNLLSKILIVAGIGLLTTPIWREILNNVLLKVGLKIFNDDDPIYGLILICLTLFYNFLSQKLVINKIRDERENKNERTTKYSCHQYQDYFGLCQVILPILDENKYIFKTFGPNSSAYETEVLRTDMTLWHTTRLEIIEPNNEILDCNIEKNIELIPSQFLPIFKALQRHIYAFKKHTHDPSYDYSLYKFPTKIEEVIKQYCLNHNEAEEKFRKTLKWLTCNLFIDGVVEIVMIGSFLFLGDRAGDVDLVLKVNTNEPSKLLMTRNQITKVARSFKLKFHKELHLTVFASNEFADYEVFVAANNFKIIFYGKRPSLFNLGIFK